MFKYKSRGVFSWRRDSADISSAEPEFHVRYVGQTLAFLPTGGGCTVQPLKTLWSEATEDKSLRKVAIKMGLAGLEMTYLEKTVGGSQKPVVFDMANISYCAADQSVNDRLFCWIYKNPMTDRLEAHAVLCSSRDKSRTMAAVLSRAFHLAYKDWKAERLREERKKAITVRKISVDDDFTLNLSTLCATRNLVTWHHKP